MSTIKRQPKRSCEMCGKEVSPADETVYHDLASDETIILFCEPCYRQRKAGKQMPEGNVQLSLDRWFDGD